MEGGQVDRPEPRRNPMTQYLLTVHGPGWPAVHEGVDSDQGWPLYLARYAALLES